MPEYYPVGCRCNLLYYPVNQCDLSSLTTINMHASSQGDGIIMALEFNAVARDLNQLQIRYLGNMRDGGTPQGATTPL